MVVGNMSKADEAKRGASNEEVTIEVGTDLKRELDRVARERGCATEELVRRCCRYITQEYPTL